jgi:hypothetical protein
MSADLNDVVHDDSPRCAYYKAEDLSKLDIEDNHAIIMHLNIRDITAKNKFDALQDLSLAFPRRPCAIVLTETWLSANSAGLYDMRHYSCHHLVRSRRGGGGVSIYVDSGGPVLGTFSSAGLLDDKDGQVLRVDTKLNNTNASIIGCYRPPKGNVKSFLDFLGSFLSEALRHTPNIVLAGDFNIDLMNDSPDARELIEMTLCTNLVGCIDQPTRIAIDRRSRRSATLLDGLFICDTLARSVNSGIVTADISDHLPIFSTLSLAAPASHKSSGRTYTYSTGRS